MANPCPSVGLALGIVATVGILYTLASKEWKRNSQTSSQNVNRGIQSYEGLWVRCTSPIPGQFQCDNYDTSFIALPADLQAQRAMMCLATIAAVGGLVCGALGLQCMKVMEGNAKKWSGRGGGFLMMLAGVLTLASVSWYAAGVVQEFYIEQATSQSFTYEFGSALYVGWISSGVALISGALMACCTCGGNEDDQDDYRYAYKPPSKPSGQQRNTEYV